MKNLVKNTKLEFKLKQHTPIIHFQHDHEGATLRATEVKAKLDRYIWENEWQGSLNKQNCCFLVGFVPSNFEKIQKSFYDIKDRYRALSYKLSFSAANISIEDITKNKLYFGNLKSGADTEKKDKKYVFSEDIITGQILCEDWELCSIIKRHIGNFFQIENFGTRQNKGFGSFQVVEMDGNKPEFSRPSKYFFKITGNANSGAPWKHIDLFYRTLRSGINMKLNRGETDQLYFKSLLFQYAKTQNHQWDKRKIRLDLFRNHPKFQEVERKRTEIDGTVQYNHGTPMLYRDMLGLSSSQDWLSYKATVTKDSVTGSIERFKSPITFKPFKKPNGWEVYIIPGEIPSEMKNAAFEVKAGGKRTTLITPNFDLDDYFKFAFSYFNDEHTLEDYVGDHFAKEEVNILSNIYEQLSNQI